MKRKNTLLGFILLVSITLAGCSTAFKVTPLQNQSQQQYYADRVECERIATYRTSSASYGYAGGYASSGTALNKDMFFNCLRGKGYTIEIQ